MLFLLESAFCLALLYGFYLLALRRETFFQINRWYLLLAPLLAFGIPALNIRMEQPVRPAPVQPSMETVAAPATPALVEWPAVVERVQTAPRAVSQALEQPVWSLQLGEILWWIYGSVAALFLLRLSWQVIAMIRFIRRCRKDGTGGLVIAENAGNTSPASFFGYVFWHAGSMPEAERRLLLEHEMVHVRQWHSLDLILIEILIALQWFNPLLYLYRSSLREVHEFIADEYVVRRTRQRYAYAGLLVQYQTAGNGAQPGLVNTFHSLIKNRLIMLAKRPSDPLRRVKYLFAMPLFAALMLLFSFRLVERLPEVRTATDLLEQYAAGLSEVVVVADRPADGVEPTPYIFYWGALQAKFNYLPATREYFAEIHISPEELREAIKREPRLWTGETLLQHLSLEINGLVVQSDYDNPEKYKAVQSELQAFAEKLSDTDYLKVGKITLPEGKTGELFIFLDGARPGWIPPAQSGLVKEKGPVITEVLWGKRSFAPMEDRYVTVNEFWDILQSQPIIRYADAPDRVPQQFNLAIFNEKGPQLRYHAEGKDAYDLETLRQKLRHHEATLQPGAVVHIAAWDAYDKVLRAASLDTVITFDPVTYQQTAVYVTKNGGLLPAPAASELIAFRLVADADPRCLLRESDTKRLGFEWGPYSATFANRMYGESYYQNDGGDRLFADRPVESHSYNLTKKDILQMLRTEPRLYQEEEQLADNNFTLDYKGYGVLIRNGAVPEDLIQLLERELQPGDIIRLTGFQARTGAARKVIATENAFKKVSGEFVVEEVEMINIDKPVGGGNALISLLMKPGQFKDLQEKLAGASGIWFQYGDIDLSPVSFVLEVRSDDPKPPLRPLILAETQTIGISVSPNPAHELATILLQLPKAGEGLLTVTDLEGKQRFSIRTDFAAGDTPFKLPLHYLKGKGLFMVQIAMPYGSATTKLVVE